MALSPGKVKDPMYGASHVVFFFELFSLRVACLLLFSLRVLSVCSHFLDFSRLLLSLLLSLHQVVLSSQTKSQDGLKIIPFVEIQIFYVVRLIEIPFAHHREELIGPR